MITPPGAALVPGRCAGERRARDARPGARRVDRQPDRRDVRRVLALRGARAHRRVVGLRRRPAPRVGRGLGPVAGRVAAWTTSKVRTVRSLRLVRPAVRVRLPTRVRVVDDGRAGAGRRRRRRHDPAGRAAAGAERSARGPRRGLPARHAGPRPPAPRRGHRGGHRCRRAHGRAAAARGARVACAQGPRLDVGGTAVQLRVEGSRGLDAGRPLRASPVARRSRCPPPVRPSARRTRPGD